MLNKTDIHYLLDWAREVSSSSPFFDCHIHPYDVLTGDIQYQANNQVEGLFSKGLFAYKAPSLGDEIIKLGKNAKSRGIEDSERSLLLASRLLYSHTGPTVFADQINLVGISGALLLPVARHPNVVEQMLDNARKMYSNDSRFLLGCPFPVGLQPVELDSFFRKAQENWDIRAIKIHPNLAGINLRTKIGRERIEATLEIASFLNLPVVIHGGRTPGLQEVDAREYGRLVHLEEINWSISTAPVIIAHTGCYGLTEEEASGDLGIVKKMLEIHSNLFADTSNLELPTLRLILKTVDRTRLLFGSDALYVPVWKAWVSFLQILCEISADPKSDLVQIASHTPAQCLNVIMNRSNALNPNSQNGWLRKGTDASTF